MSLISCDAIFHDEDDPYLTIDSYQEKIDIINGIYINLILIHNSDYFKALRRSDDINLYNKYSIRDLYGGVCQDIYIVDDADIAASIYHKAYTGIVNINKLLTQLDEGTDQELYGELYFLRGYLYLKLARLFGDPPLVDDYDVNYLIERPAFREVYEFIEADLLRAIDYLPDTYTGARVPNETPHKGTAKALLAEAYLSMAGYPVNDKSKYAEAAAMAGDVIENAEFYGYGLLPDLVDLWKNERSYVKENVFGLFFDIDSYGLTENALPGFYIDEDYYEKDLFVRSPYHPGFYFFDHFPDSYRKIKTLTKGYYETDEVFNPEKEDDPFNIGDDQVLYYTLFDPANDPCPFVQNAVYTKWVDLDMLKRYSSGYTRSIFRTALETNLYLLRYAHVLLTYAEAKGRMGEPDASAYEAVNMIRRRANNVDYSSPSEYDLTPGLSGAQFADSVVLERAWELCFEPDGRWFDIVRLDLKDELESQKYPNDVADEVDENLLSDDWYFFLIPQEDRWVNPNY